MKRNCYTLNESHTLKRITQRLNALFLGATSALPFAVQVAHASLIDDTIKDSLRTIYGVVTGISAAAGCIAVAACAFIILLGGEKGLEQAKKTLIYTGVGIMIIYLAPTIVVLIRTAMGNIDGIQTFKLFPDV
jgi:type IV secretory pathway VirB2 component (pilin)